MNNVNSIIQSLNLDTTQLSEIAIDLKDKIIKGLSKNGMEIKALPTFVNPRKDKLSGDAVVFDLGGTNFRAATVSLGSEVVISEMVEESITEMKTEAFLKEDLYSSIFEIVNKLKFPKGLPVGYCFSYPSESLISGDAKLLKWVKGVRIEDMEGKVVGEPLLNFFNRESDFALSKITVINDTIASLFSGLKNAGYDVNVGLIVGTGTNMATFYPSSNVPKLKKEISNLPDEIPVNLESGNFSPPYLTIIDEKVDKLSDNPGMQRFEKAVSGMYLGRIFNAIFPGEKFDNDLDAEGLTYIINHPEEYKDEYVEVAFKIYERSAKLIAASLLGLIKSIHEENSSIRRIQIVAEGSLFWSKLDEGQLNYSDIVKKWLDKLLNESGMKDKVVDIVKIENANLIGAAMAGL